MWIMHIALFRENLRLLCNTAEVERDLQSSGWVTNPVGYAIIATIGEEGMITAMRSYAEVALVTRDSRPLDRSDYCDLFWISNNPSDDIQDLYRFNNTGSWYIFKDSRISYLSHIWEGMWNSVFREHYMGFDKREICWGRM